MPINWPLHHRDNPSIPAVVSGLGPLWGMVTISLMLLSSSNLLAAIYRKGLGTVLGGHHLGSTVELDLSKSYISGYIDFAARKPILRSLEQEFDFRRELLFYLEQFKTTLQPRYFLLELDYYPMTSLGVTVKKQHRPIYDDAEIRIHRRHINPFELLATRYEQPYSLSFFIGEILPFFSRNGQTPGSPEASQGQSGSAVMGHVLTVSNRMLIKLNAQKDRWFQYAFKVKGTNQTQWDKKKWMFQLGFIVHENPTFFNSLGAFIVRDFASKKNPSFWQNLKIEYLFNIPLEKVPRRRDHKKRRLLDRFTTFQKIIFGRNYHFDSFIVGLDVGIKWELFKKSPQEVFSETSLIVAPNLSW